jgi:hypothetical protein
VDGLERELGDRVRIIRINIHDTAGSQLAPIMGVEFAPTFIFYDPEGTELWRQIGGFDPQKVRDTLAQ